MTKDEVDDILTSWTRLNKVLGNLTEADVKMAMNREMVGNRRKDIVIRLHQRYTILRSARERAELVEALVEPVPEFLA